MESLKERYAKLLAGGHSEGKKFIWGNTPASNLSTLSSEIVNLILSEAVQTRTSDIHIEPGPDNILIIRFRIDGKLYEVLQVKQTANITIIPRIKVLANMPVDAMTSRTALDGRFTVKLGEVDIDFRIATFPTILGEKVAIRILNKDIGILNLKKLGLAPGDMTRLENIVLRKSGLIVVSGPTGAGKTTTLYSILNRLHTSNVNIVTLEDPVEYQINGINQCSVNKKDENGFANGLKAILRQDPDVILIGEVRDVETAQIAVRASITGHLVLTSLHANSALGTVMRLINMGLERYVVSYSLIGAMAQRLVPRLCESCRVPYKINVSTLNRLWEQCGISPEAFLPNKKQANPSAGIGSMHYIGKEERPESPAEDLVIYKNKGCAICNGTGYLGRMGIYEVVSFAEELHEAIVHNAGMHDMEAIAARKGFRSLAIDAIDKLKGGYVTIDDIYPILLERTL